MERLKAKRGKNEIIKKEIQKEGRTEDRKKDIGQEE
jgi:hypothetical protein